MRSCKGYIINPISHIINPISHINRCGEQSANYRRSFERSHSQETTETQLKQTTKAKVATFRIFWLKQTTKAKVATFRILKFLFSFVQFWNVLIVFVYVLFDVFINNKKKKT